jgi:beta-galactosidase
VVEEDGKVIFNQQIGGIDVAPATIVDFPVSKWLPKTKATSEYHVELKFVLQKAEAWAEAGFEIASNQLALKPVSASVNHFTPIPYTETDEGYIIKQFDYAIFISKKTGALESYKLKGKEQVSVPLLPHFTRPQTDNDKRGFKTHRVLKAWYENKPNLIRTHFTRDNRGIAVTSVYSIANDSALAQVTYEISKNGVIKVNYTLNAEVQPGLPNIPKIGMQMGIDSSFKQIEYFGRGPLENYIDRRYGADVGIYNQNIFDFMEPYVVPQENGNRTDVRWMYLHNQKTKEGLLIVADSLLSMSAWPYTEENIQNAKHTNKLKDAGFITLNIDLIQMGVGGNDSWSEVAAPLAQYQIKPGYYQYSFYIVPFNAKKKSAGERAKEIK